MIFDLLLTKYKNSNGNYISYCRSIIYIGILEQHNYITKGIWYEGLVLLNALYLPARKYRNETKPSEDHLNVLHSEVQHFI